MFIINQKIEIPPPCTECVFAYLRDSYVECDSSNLCVLYTECDSPYLCVFIYSIFYFHLILVNIVLCNHTGETSYTNNYYINWTMHCIPLSCTDCDFTKPHYMLLHCEYLNHLTDSVIIRFSVNLYPLNIMRIMSNSRKFFECPDCEYTFHNKCLLSYNPELGSCLRHHKYIPLSYHTGESLSIIYYKYCMSFMPFSCTECDYKYMLTITREPSCF